MGYGIQITNDNSNIMVDTDAKSSMQITTESSHAASSNWTQAAGEFTLWNYNGTLESKFNQTGSNIFNGTPFAFNVIRLREVTQTTPPSRTTSYGIECYNGSSVVSYTDLFTKSYKILSVYAPGQLIGDTTIYSGAVGSDIYVGAGKPSYASNFTFGNFSFTSNSIIFKNNFVILTNQEDIYNTSTVMLVQRRN